MLTEVALHGQDSDSHDLEATPSCSLNQRARSSFACERELVIGLVPLDLRAVGGVDQPLVLLDGDQPVAPRVLDEDRGIGVLERSDRVVARDVVGKPVDALRRQELLGEVPARLREARREHVGVDPVLDGREDAAHHHAVVDADEADPRHVDPVRGARGCRGRRARRRRPGGGTPRTSPPRTRGPGGRRRRGPDGSCSSRR